MPKKKSPEDFFQRAREKGSDINKSIVNGSAVKKHIEPKTEKNYARALGLWNGYARDHPGADPYDLETLKDFVRMMAYGIDGIYGDPKAGEKSVLQYWKDFTAGWRRHASLIPPETTQSVTNFIKIHLRDELGLAHRKRLRSYGTTNHFIHLGTQLWEKDWQIYDKPRIRVDTWAKIQLYVFTSARVGEYIESTCRAGSGRGLYYRDMTFGVFRNERGEAEFAIQVVRDAKNMTLTPEKRPEHSVHEGLEPRPLFCNPVLTMLARAIADNAFRDYSTMEELLEIEPPENEMYHLRQNEKCAQQALFSTSSPPARWKKADTFSRRLRELGVRAGYLRPPTIHDFRAEGLYLVDKLYSAAQRMKHGGHRDERTYCDSYMPNNAGTDLQGGYFDGKLRSIVNDRFRGLTLHRNPELWQALPARKQHELEDTPEFAAIEIEIDVLAPKAKTDPAAKERRQTLMADKRKLVAEELSRCQKLQPSKLLASPDDAELMGYHRSQFHRIRRLMPERDRLASNLFLVAPIRSNEGRSVLRDMIALCRQEAEVPFRPGLEPKKCTCLMADHKLELDRKPAAERWRHIYGCYKKRLVTTCGFAELCFDCSEWILGRDEWNHHCLDHLRRPEALPIQCNPFVYGGTLACPGYCPFCLGDTALPAPTRMQQFLDREKWKAHIDRHIERLDDCKATRCPHPRARCVEAFQSVLEMKFHLQDVHCIESTKSVKRRRSSSELEPQSHRRKRARQIEDRDSDVKRDTWAQFTYDFVDETEKLYGQHGTRISTTPSISSQRSSASSITTTDEGRDAVDTPASSVCTDITHKLDPRLHYE
ncbi:hypothetical protein N7G274_005171 [Stereocaulon virgatum]|uniref:C2H2-type domain-containing protein n=1 Tax=Stereocaulon virgatum TaxID=373712 RepID=A0ABR4A8H9_9LECA